MVAFGISKRVHGDIRHLEIATVQLLQIMHVHGDIRHLEMYDDELEAFVQVHGDIRHLENLVK